MNVIRWPEADDGGFLAEEDAARWLRRWGVGFDAAEATLRAAATARPRGAREADLAAALAGAHGLPGTEAAARVPDLVALLVRLGRLRVTPAGRFTCGTP